MASITLDWNANPSTDNVTGYEVYGANGTGVAFGSCALLATVNALTWTETGLANGQARTYYLKAVNALGVSATPEGPLNITAAAASSTYVQNAGGTPSVQEGTHASRPAAGTAGRIYIETDTASIFRDNGASWDQIGAAPINQINYSCQDISTKPVNSIINRFSLTLAAGFPASLIVSGKVDTAPGADTTVTLLKDGSSFATIKWSSGSTTPVLVSCTLTAGASGDYIDLQSPANWNGMAGVFSLAIQVNR